MRTDRAQLFAHLGAAATVLGLLSYYFMPLSFLFAVYGLGVVFGVIAIVLSIRGKRLGLIGYIEAGFAILPLIIGLILYLSIQTIGR